MKLKLLSLLLLFHSTTYLALAAEPVKAKPAAPVRSGPSAESLERRSRSIERLKSESVPVVEDLPVLPDSHAAKTRTREQIAQRAIAVCLAAIKAERAEQETVEGLIVRYKAKKFFTPEEAAFIDTNAPSNEVRTKFLWRYEDLWVYMWALGYVETLNRPEEPCDVRKTVSFLSERTLESFIADAKPRSTEELLDEADLIYRYNWAINDARKHGRKAPAGLDRGVVQERANALNWLVGSPN